MKCIIDFASLGELPLRDFLIKLSLRMFTGLIHDELKEVLLSIIKSCLTPRTDKLIRVNNNLALATSMIQAATSVFPNYADEIRKLAIK